MSFPLGAAYLFRVQRVVFSDDWRSRFAPYLHDGMCCDEEWRFRLQQGLEGVSLRSPPADVERARANAYSDYEKRREVQALTPFTRSIAGLRDTLNHILRRFADVTCDSKMLRAFSSVIYPTLRQAVIDLNKPANVVATPLLCETLQRAVRFLLQIFCISSAAAPAGEFLGDKCIVIMRQLLEHLLAAYRQLWYHEVDPPDSGEFCALMIALWLICSPFPDFLSFNACYSCLPQRVRLSTVVSQTLALAHCFLCDSTVRLSELLGAAPYSVVVLVASRLNNLRCRSVKYLASAKLNLPFGSVVRYLGLRPDSPEQCARSFFILRALCKQQDTPATSSNHSAASVPLFGFDPDSKIEPTQVDFAQRGPWAKGSNGSFSLRLHLQAIHVREGNLAYMNVGTEPALLQHPLRLTSWREALGTAHDVQPHLHSTACDEEPCRSDGASAMLGLAADSAPLPSSRTMFHARSFVFMSWPRTSDGASSAVHLG